MVKFHFLRSLLVRRTATYAISSSFNALVAFLLLPLLTAYLTPYDYGVVEVFLTLTAMMTAIILFGGNTLISKEYFKSGAEYEEYVGNILVVSLLITLVLGIVLGTGVISTSLLARLNVSASVVILALCVGLSNAIIQVHLVLYQLEKKSIQYAIFLNSRAICDMVLSLILIIILGFAWQGRLTGVATASFIYLIFSIWLIYRRGMSLRFSRCHTTQILRMGYPLMLAALTGWSVGMVDKLMINGLIDTYSAGIYAVGYRFGMIVMLVETAFSLAWLPYFYEKMNQNENGGHIRIVKVTAIYITLLLLFAVSFGLLGKYLLYFMVDERYHAAGSLIVLISMAYFLDGVWKMFAGYLIFKERTGLYSLIVLLSAIFNIALNYVLLPKLGIAGAAWATLASFFLGACLTVVVSIKICTMPWGRAFRGSLVLKTG